jgi:hypothetical protein
MSWGRLLLDLMLTGLASIGVLWAELNIWQGFILGVTPTCGAQKLPDFPSALAVWAGMFGTVLAVSARGGGK